jgi:hypothetical protein
VLSLAAITYWRAIPFVARFSVPLVVMIACHTLGYWFRFLNDRVPLGNQLFLAGSILYGLALAVLVEPIVHAQQLRAGELYPAVLFLWTAGMLPLSLVLSSPAMLVLSNLVAIVWFVSHMSAGSGVGFTLLYLAVFLFSIHWSYSTRSLGLATVCWLGLAIWWGMMPVAEDVGREGYFWVAALGPLLLLAGQRHADDDPFAVPCKRLGALFALAALLAIAKPSVCTDLVSPDSVVSAWLCVLAALGIALALGPAPRRLDYRTDWPTLAAVAATTFVPGVLGTATRMSGGAGIAATAVGLALLSNTAAVAVALGMVIWGAQSQRASRMLLGVLYFVAWVLVICLDLTGRLSTAALILTLASPAVWVTGRYWTRWLGTTHEAIPRENG